MTEQQRQQYISQGTKDLILDDKKQRYNLDKEGRVKTPNNPYYVLNLKEIKIYKIDKSIIKK